MPRSIFEYVGSNTWNTLPPRIMEEGGEQPSSPPTRHLTAVDFDRFAMRYGDITDFRSIPERPPISLFEEAVDTYVSSLGLSTRRTRRTREERTMNISIKAPEFTDAERQALSDFYELVLKNGYATWPSSNARAVLWINGTARRVKTYREWSLTEDNLYIGYGVDRGEGELADPTTRLAIVTALMSLTGHTSNPELMALVERRFAQITQGNYQAMVAPLGQRPDNRPVEQIAWSADGRLAAQLDGDWVRPLTGEPIEVGEGWVVLDVVEREARPLSSGQEEEIASVSTDTGSDQERFAIQVPTLRDFAAIYGWSLSTTTDGRDIIRFRTLELAQEQRLLATSFAVPNVVLESDGGGAFLTTNVLPEPPIPF